MSLLSQRALQAGGKLGYFQYWLCAAVGPPTRHFAVSSTYTSFYQHLLTDFLVILGGDIELNAGPPATIYNQYRHDLRIGCLDAFPAENKTDRILNCIDEHKLDILAITAKYIKADHPATIKSDPASTGHSIHHQHRFSETKVEGGGIALIARDALKVRPLNVTGSYRSFEISVVRITIRTGRLNVLIVYWPPRSVDLYKKFRDLLD